MGALALGAVGTVAGFGVAAQRDLASLEHAPAYALQAPPGLLTVSYTHLTLPTSDLV